MNQDQHELAEAIRRATTPAKMSDIDQLERMLEREVLSLQKWLAELSKQVKVLENNSG